MPHCFRAKERFFFYPNGQRKLQMYVGVSRGAYLGVAYAKPKCLRILLIYMAHARSTTSSIPKKRWSQILIYCIGFIYLFIEMKFHNLNYEEI
jgi:hypothetical protein